MDRTLRQRLIALAGLAAIVGGVIAVLLLAGLFGNRGEGEAVELVETPGSGSLAVGPEVGKLAPDFVISDYEGKRHRLSDFRGQVVFVNFWATWCVPCRAELPEIQQLEEESEDVVVITVARREPLGDAKAFFRDLPNLEGQNGVSFGVNGIDPDDTLWDAYRGLGMPTSIFVDPEGVVSSRANGLIQLEDMRAAVAEAQNRGAEEQ